MRRLTLALGITAVVAGGLAAASAFATAYGNLDFFAGGGGTAGWTGTGPSAHSTVRLVVPAGGYAGISLKHVGATAPSDAPTFTTDAYAAGSPRLVIEFSGGARLFGYPSQFDSLWEVSSCASVPANGYTTYAVALAALQGGSQGDSSACGGDVTAVYVVADAGGGPETDDITAFTYDGTAYIGVSADDRAVADLDDLIEDLRSGFADVTGAPVGPADRYANAGD
jgi:hypothetical protein